MITIPAGWFWMGSDRYYLWERPRHQVFLDAFAMAPTSVTRAEYQVFLKDSGRDLPAGWEDPRFEAADLPVVGVNWHDASEYCNWLSEQQRRQFSLPTEAEWEKACRGGQDDMDYAWGNTESEAFDYFHGEWKGPRPVKTWRANGYGLFNMGENVHEWCLDWYGAEYYRTSPALNPAGPENGTRRVSRGGSWRHQVKASRAAHRSSLPPDYRYTDYGFRIVCRDPR